MHALLSWDGELAAASRFARLRSATRVHPAVLTAAELAWLVGMGVVAGLITTLWEGGLRLPGHAILRGVVPLAMGLALVPRRHGGAVMGLGAVIGILVGCGLGAAAPGSGSTTSLLLMGPVMDQVLRMARKDGLRLHVSFALAGWLSNYIALAVRAGQKWLALDPSHAMSYAWLGRACLSYALCGILAGILIAAIGFRTRGRDPLAMQAYDR